MKLLKNKIFLTILATDIIQQMAIWIRNLSIMFFIMDVTNSNPLMISALNMIEYIPMLLLTFIGGIIADKYNPKKLMLIGDFFSFISFVILGFFISKGYIGTIFLAVLVSAIVTQFSYPASQKYFKEYIDEEDIESAIGVSQLLSSVFFIVGPFIGSYFYFNFGMDNTLLIISGLFLISIALITTLPNKKFEVIDSDGGLEDIKLTFKYIKDNHILSTFTKMFFIISFAIGISNNLDIFLVTQRLGLEDKYYQFFSGIAGIGVLVGGVLYLVLSKYLNNMKIVYISMGIFAVTVFFEGYSKIASLTMILQFIDNALAGLLSGYVMATITKITDQTFIGKVNGLTATLMYLGIMVGTLVSGFIMKYSSIVVAFSIASLAFLVSSVMLYKADKIEK
ncbi:MAG: MFS transporter [Peptostreptococcaceae bacterium]